MLTPQLFNGGEEEDQLPPINVLSKRIRTVIILFLVDRPSSYPPPLVNLSLISCNLNCIKDF